MRSRQLLRESVCNGDQAQSCRRGIEGRDMDDVRYGFLSTLDHLPCDVVRILWTIQSLDIGDSEEGEHSEEMLRQAQHLLELVRQEGARVRFEKQELERFAVIKERYDGHVRKRPKLKPLPPHKPIKIRITMKSRYPEAEKEQKLLQQKKIRQLSSRNDDHYNQSTDAEVYCFCRDVSYGPMIACDNKSCAIEWFHYQCVGLTDAPRDNEKWFCSDKCRKEYDDKRKKKKVVAKIEQIPGTGTGTAAAATTPANTTAKKKKKKRKNW